MGGEPIDGVANAIFDLQVRTREHKAQYDHTNLVLESYSCGYLFMTYRYKLIRPGDPGGEVLLRVCYRRMASMVNAMKRTGTDAPLRMANDVVVVVSVVFDVVVVVVGPVVVVVVVVKAQLWNAAVALARMSVQLVFPMKNELEEPPVHELPPHCVLTSGSSRATRTTFTKLTIQ